MSTTPRVTVDDAGRSVTVPATVSRIVTLSPALTEFVFALGRGGALVATDLSSDYPAAAGALPHVGRYSSPDLEAIVAAQPDIVLAAPIHAAKLVPALEGQGIVVVVLGASTLDGVIDDTRKLGEILDEASAAAELADRLTQERHAVETAVGSSGSPRTYIEITSSLTAAGPGSLLGDLVRIARGTNIVSTSEVPYPQLDLERIVAADPEVILLAEVASVPTSADVSARPGWGVISAVRSGRIVVLDPAVAMRPGPRVAEALAAIAKALHPEAVVPA